ncbi:rhamnan synthesis F family protein [uncultured Rhodoblastus sp.]|uniref:rhamnan synthesis F family protein n=1 Tax=uncultured Rhodoblastus sp. TaxID=543037 RepID=UPI0025CC7BAB|nr:rhamnan synthesis F family protein [uncultured Rhodoblastus sp.]
MSINDFQVELAETLSPIPERIYPTVRPWTKTKTGKLKKIRRLINDAIERREGGSAARIKQRIEGRRQGDGTKIAIYAHYASTGRVSEMVFTQIAIYVELGFEINFVTMSPKLLDADIVKLKMLCRTIILRRSFGRDFGAWRDVLRSEALDRRSIEELLLLNDSVLGPIRPLEPMFKVMRATEGLWGLTDSDQSGAHLQTYFLLVRGRAAVKAVVSFFDSLRLSSDKEETIRRGELQFSRRIANAGVPVFAFFGRRQVEAAALEDPLLCHEVAMSIDSAFYVESDYNEEIRKLRLRRGFITHNYNPTHQMAEVLVAKFGFPFIKTELIVVNPCNMTIAKKWSSFVKDDSPCSVEMITEHLCHL